MTDEIKELREEIAKLRERVAVLERSQTTYRMPSLMRPVDVPGGPLCPSPPDWYKVTCNAEKAA